MAWIESNQEVGRHPKTKKLARILDISIPAAVGHLHFLWWWALDFAQNGVLTKYDAYDIADAVCWDGDADKLFIALVDAGYIDVVGDEFIIHDWMDYAGKLVDRREKDKARKSRKDVSSEENQADKTSKNREKSGKGVVSVGNPKDSVGNLTDSVGNPKDSVGNLTDSIVTVHYSTLPNSTVHNTTQKQKRNTLSKEPARNASPECERLFERFWTCYPKRVGKKFAKEAWQKIRPDPELTDIMIAAVQEQQLSPQWKAEGGRFIPNPTKWLEGGYWENKVDVASEALRANENGNACGNFEQRSYDDDFYSKLISKKTEDTT